MPVADSHQPRLQPAGDDPERDRPAQAQPDRSQAGAEQAEAADIVGSRALQAGDPEHLRQLLDRVAGGHGRPMQPARAAPLWQRPRQIQRPDRPHAKAKQGQPRLVLILDP